MLRRPSRLLVALVAVVATATLVPVVGAVAQSGDEQRLADARQRLEAISSDIDDAERDADDADAELADADERLREVEEVVNDVARQLDRQRVAVGEAEDRLAEVEEEAEVVRAALADRATRMFKQGAVREFDLLLNAGDAEDALARTTYLRALAVGDQATAEGLAAAEVAVEAERERLDAERQILDDMLAEQEELLEEVARIRESRALAAAEARERVAQLESEQDDLEAEQAEIEELIRQRQAEERARAREQREAAERAAREQAAAPPSSNGGGGGGGGTPSTGAPSASGYAWPLCAPVTSEYGPRWGRMHQGIDQGAPTGTPIGASKAGTVIFAGTQGGYGQLVLVDHGDGVVTAYAHMSRIAVSNGQSVSQGQRLGDVGSTGNSTGPHLHFETRVNGSAVNPRQYLSGSPC
ncbi:M23 family metallopeptidase [Nitriliruptoraceae bacterium ZYF776]|nr:M23 family metallopeptidase [Profundirhabdus halotolerans]